MAVSLLVAAGFAILVAAGFRGPRWWRAAAFGGAAALLFAFVSSLTKATTTLITGGWGHVLTHWEPYALAFTGMLGFFMLQNALHAGPIAASRAVMVIVNPLVSIAIGVFVFQEHLRTGPAFIAGEAVSLIVMCGGAFILSQSPLITGSSAEGEMLSRPVPAP